MFRDSLTIFVKRYEARISLMRVANEDDLRGAIACLVTDLSRYVSGQDFAVDGGRWVVG